MKMTNIKLALLTSGMLLPMLVGCGSGPSSSSTSTSTPTSHNIPTFSGTVMSGITTPVVGATVNIYATGSVSAAPTTANAFGYGQPATLLGTASAVTDSKGAFTFPATSTACPLGSYAYVTASGGNAGGGTNTGSLLMAVLGPCSSLYTSDGSTYAGPVPVIDEATTIAAGYALVNFTTTTGTTVNISAPVTDNFSDGSAAWNGTAYAACTACQGNSKLDTTSGNEITYSNGLQHAVTLAMNLVNVITGKTNACIQNGKGAATCPGGGQTGIIPMAVVNSLANSYQACVLTSGASGACPSLYSDTKAKTVTPTNTLQSVLNLAKNPAVSVAAIYNLQSGLTPAYTPTLAGFPSQVGGGASDWIIAIAYVGGGLSSPQFLALDSDDNVYVDSAGAGQAGNSLIAVSNSGDFIYGENAPVLSADGTTQNTIGTPTGIAVDNLGHVFVAAGTTDGTTSGAYEYNAANGNYMAFLGHNPAINSATGVAVDRRNNLWISYANTGVGNLDYLLQGGTTTGNTGGYSFFANSNVPSGSTLGAPIAADGAFSQVSSGANTQLAFAGIDQKQNVWAVVQGLSPATQTGTITTQAKQLGIFVNGNSASPASAPVYDNSTTPGTGVFTNPEILATYSSTCTIPSPWSVAFDSSGNAYTSEYLWVSAVTHAEICITPATYTGGVLTGTGATGIYSFASTSSTKAMPQGLAMDGNNVLWVPMFYSVTSGYFGLFGYDTVAKAALTTETNGFRGCFVTTTNICAVSVSLPNNAITSSYMTSANSRGAAIDSSGNIWSTQPDFGTLVETVGLASPTVPLLAAAKFGVLP